MPPRWSYLDEKGIPVWEHTRETGPTEANRRSQTQSASAENTNLPDSGKPRIGIPLDVDVAVGAILLTGLFAVRRLCHCVGHLVETIRSRK